MEVFFLTRPIWLGSSDVKSLLRFIMRGWFLEYEFIRGTGLYLLHGNAGREMYQELDPWEEGNVKRGLSGEGCVGIVMWIVGFWCVRSIGAMAFTIMRCLVLRRLSMVWSY